MTNTKGRLAEAYTRLSPCSTKLTDEGFSYTPRGETSDLYASTPNSGTYFHSTATFWSNGVLAQLQGFSGSSLNYNATYNLDGEGRPASNGWLTSTTYNAAGRPTQLNFSSGDSDTYTYDSNTGRMTQYKFTVGGQSVVGNLTWNANSTLGSLGITDPFDSPDNQTCNYAHDDLTRIASVNCGASIWQQNFSYDPFGNITASGTMSYLPIYSSSTNHILQVGSSTATYDANGNVTYDGVQTYSWDADGHATTISGEGVTYDAFGRRVEINNSGTYTQNMYSPTGFLMEIPSLQKKFVPLPGGAQVVYTPNAPGAGYYYRHADWLGSIRLASTTTQTMYYDLAYSPYGTPYAVSGPADYTFTGVEHNFPNLYDFPAREFAIQGRWPSPDPAGLSAVAPSEPQSWNRYAYVLNSPLRAVDPLGLDCVFVNNAGDGYDEIDSELGSDACAAQGGVYFKGTINPDFLVFDPNSDWVFNQDSKGNSQWSCSANGVCDQDSLTAFGDWLLGGSGTVATPGWTPGTDNCPSLGFGCEALILNDQRKADKALIQITDPFWDYHRIATTGCGANLAQINDISRTNLTIDDILLGKGGAVLVKSLPGFKDATSVPKPLLNNMRNANLKKIDQLLGACGSGKP